MVSLLTQTDPAIWFSILVKAAAYGTSLLAAGGALVLFVLPMVSESGAQALVRTTLCCVALAAIFSLLRVPMQASFLMGGTWAGAMDPMLLQVVGESPLGEAVWLRLLGLALILSLFWNVRVAKALAVCGAVLVALSFAMRGHSLQEPRLLLATLIVVHILGLAFWFGALAPLSRAAREDLPCQAGALASAFGVWAVWIVGALVAAGASLLVLILGAPMASLATSYTQLFLLKLGLFCAVLGVAAWNKLRLTPQLCDGAPTAAEALRRSIRWESAFICAILLVTATVTTLASPPGF